MAVETTTAFSGPYNANGATTTFGFTFIAKAADEIGVLLRDSGGVDSVVSTSAYTVTLNANGTGSVVFTTAPASGNSVYIYSDVSFQHSIDFEDGTGWKASPVNEASDRAALRDVYLKDKVDRGLIVPVGETGFTLPAAANRASKFLAFDTDGDALAAVGELDTVPVGAFGATLAANTTAADARADLAVNSAAEMAASGGSALLGFLQAGTGAVARTAQEKMREILTPEDFGAVGDDATASGAAFRSAYNALPATGGKIDVRVGTFQAAADGGGVLTIAKPTSIVGHGSTFCAIRPTSSTPNDTIVVRPSALYNHENIRISDIALHNPSAGTRTDRHGIYLDTQVASSNLPRLTIERMVIGQGSGYGIYHLNNGSNNVNGGLYASTIRDCSVKGGIKLENSGDSINILECLISGTNIGVDASLVAGASCLAVERCNITNANGAFRLDNGARFRFIGNNVENLTAGALANNGGAVVNITGSGGVIYGGLIQGGLISAFGSTTATHLIKLANCRGTIIDNVTLLAGVGGITAIEIAADCQDVRIGKNIYNSTIATKVVDNGVGTMGVIKTATLQNSWVEYAASTETLQFIKDPWSGVVHLYGSIKDGTTVNGTVLTTLPAGFRPTEIIRATALGVNAGTPVQGQINIESNGNVSITYFSGVQELHINLHFPADNVGNAVSVE